VVLLLVGSALPLTILPSLHRILGGKLSVADVYLTSAWSIFNQGYPGYNVAPVGCLDGFTHIAKLYHTIHEIPSVKAYDAQHKK
jgi:hypothetical protein